MKLVQSSVPGAVERDRAISLLTERATLTRMVCRELLDSDGSDRRPQTALFLLLRWIDETQREHVRISPRADDGLAQMLVPEGYADLAREIETGARVCNALFMLLTADTVRQANEDRDRIKTSLAAYWDQHAAPVPVVRRPP